MTVRSGKDVREEELLFTIGGSATFIVPLWKLMWQFLRKQRIDIPQDPAITHLCLNPKKSTSYFRDIFSFMFIAVIHNR